MLPVSSSRLFALALAASIAAAPALGEGWVCKFKKSRGNGTPQQVLLDVGASGTTRVADSITQYYVGHPVDAISTRNTASTLTVSWALPAVKDEKGQWIPGLRFNLFLKKDSGAAQISGRPSGNYRDVRSTGTCKRKG